MTADWDRDLIGHWMLKEDGRDASPYGNHGVNYGVRFGRQGAEFNGQNSHLGVPSRPELRLDEDDFSIAAWLRAPRESVGTVGDIIGKFDFLERRGFHLGVTSLTGGHNHQIRTLHFGLDDESEPRWRDCGRLGAATHIYCFALHDGRLYAGTAEYEAGRPGRVHRYESDGQWTDCGSPGQDNLVGKLFSWRERLYATTGGYIASGSVLFPPAVPYQQSGGALYRYEGDQEWTRIGKGLSYAVLGNTLYGCAGDGFYIDEDPAQQREFIPCPRPNKQSFMANLQPFHGAAYVAMNHYAPLTDCYGVMRCRMPPQAWEGCGHLGKEGQIYSLTAHRGELYAGTWPSCQVYRFRGGQEWELCGHLGGPTEKEVMDLAVYNGKLYGGTLPLAEIYRFDDLHNWQKVGRVDHTPHRIIRRAWSMIVAQGRLFCGTLPSGHVYAMQAGVLVTHDRELPDGWRHVAAIRQGSSVALYLDGQRVASATFAGEQYALSNDAPLRIGLGANDFFNGHLRDVRLYRRALDEAGLQAILRKGSPDD